MSNQQETPNAETQETSETTETTTETSESTETESSLISGSQGEEEGSGASAESFGEPITAEALSLPEGLELEDGQTENFLSLVNEAESRADLANAMLKLYAEVAAENAEVASNAWNEQQTAWQNEIKADADLGGDKLDESLATANSIAKRYGGQELLSAMNLTGMGNNLAFLRFLIAVNNDLPQEATPVDGKPASGQASLADRLFGGN